MSIISCLGGCGSGKTHKLQTLVGESLLHHQGWRFLVLDLNSEWPGPRYSGRIRHAVTTHPENCKKALEKGHNLVIVRPPISAAELTPAPWATVADIMASRAIEHGRPTCLVLPEAHTVAREGYPLPRAVGTIVHRYRHTHTGLWCDSQHFGDLKKEVLKESARVYIFATGAPQDLDSIRRYGGPYAQELLAAVRTCSERAALGEPGWYVRLDALRPFPPYVPQRD